MQPLNKRLNNKRFYHGRDADVIERTIAEGRMAGKHQQTIAGKEKTMDKNQMYECGICYFQGIARDFTPITVSASFAALECPKCLNNDTESFEEFTFAEQQAA